MARGDYKEPIEKDPKDYMWVITAAQIKTIRGTLGPLSYEKVSAVIETLEQLKPLRDYIGEAEKAPVKGSVAEKHIKLSLRKGVPEMVEEEITSET